LQGLLCCFTPGCYLKSWQSVLEQQQDYYVAHRVYGQQGCVPHEPQQPFYRLAAQENRE